MKTGELFDKLREIMDQYEKGPEFPVILGDSGEYCGGVEVKVDSLDGETFVELNQ